MRVSFIGMSNIGKSFWSKRVAAETGCPRIDCDTLIEKKLAPELATEGYRGLQGVAKWMGFPFNPSYAQNSRRYIELEQSVMRETLDTLHSNAPSRIVVDTTGSVIYTGDDMLSELRATTRIIYLEASEDHIKTLFRRYTAHPKPVIWHESYKPETGESPQQTLKRCYPELLRDRARRYRDIAHVIIPFEKHSDPHMTVGALIG